MVGQATPGHSTGDRQSFFVSLTQPRESCLGFWQCSAVQLREAQTGDRAAGGHEQVTGEESRQATPTLSLCLSLVLSLSLSISLHFLACPPSVLAPVTHEKPLKQALL